MPMEDAMAAFTCWDSEGSMYLEFTACFLFLFFLFCSKKRGTLETSLCGESSDVRGRDFIFLPCKLTPYNTWTTPSMTHSMSPSMSIWRPHVQEKPISASGYGKVHVHVKLFSLHGFTSATLP